MANEYRRGQIYYANLNPINGHEQAGRRPVLIIQNDIGNQFSPTTIVAALTTALPPKCYPTEVRLAARPVSNRTHRSDWTRFKRLTRVVWNATLGNWMRQPCAR